MNGSTNGTATSSTNGKDATPEATTPDDAVTTEVPAPPKKRRRFFLRSK